MHYELFYNKNALQMILQKECITIKCITNNFAIKIHYERFLYENVLRIILL